MKMNNRIFKVYRVIKIEDLQTDLSYQSPIDESIVKKIVNNFDENALGTITISQRDVHLPVKPEQEDFRTCLPDKNNDSQT